MCGLFIRIYNFKPYILAPNSFGIRRKTDKNYMQMPLGSVCPPKRDRNIISLLTNLAKNTELLDERQTCMKRQI